MVDLRTYAALAQEADREIARLLAENARLREALGEVLGTISGGQKGYAGHEIRTLQVSLTTLQRWYAALEETPDA